jgi:hypothetical protein
MVFGGWTGGTMRHTHNRHEEPSHTTESFGDISVASLDSETQCGLRNREKLEEKLEASAAA